MSALHLRSSETIIDDSKFKAINNKERSFTSGKIDLPMTRVESTTPLRSLSEGQAV